MGTMMATTVSALPGGLLTPVDHTTLILMLQPNIVASQVKLWCFDHDLTVVTYKESNLNSSYRLNQQDIFSPKHQFVSMLMLTFDESYTTI